jgi:hypothetical protein
MSSRETEPSSTSRAPTYVDEVHASLLSPMARVLPSGATRMARTGHCHQDGRVAVIAANSATKRSKRLSKSHPIVKGGDLNRRQHALHDRGVVDAWQEERAHHRGYADRKRKADLAVAQREYEQALALHEPARLPDLESGCICAGQHLVGMDAVDFGSSRTRKENADSSFQSRS